MIIKSMSPADFDQIRVRQWQVEELSWSATRITGVAFSGWREGRCIGAAGLEPKWEGVKVAWVLFSEEWLDHVLPISRFVRYVIANDPSPRIEAYMRSDNPGAGRWARTIGMKCEAERLRKFGPNGCDMDLYARVK